MPALMRCCAGHHGYLSTVHKFAPTEHCDGLCWSCGQGQSFPKGGWSIALWAPVTAWHNGTRRSQVHWHTFALTVTQPQPKASKRFPSSPRRFEENLQNVRSGGHAGFCRASHADVLTVGASASARKSMQQSAAVSLLRAGLHGT